MGLEDVFAKDSIADKRHEYSKLWFLYMVDNDISALLPIHLWPEQHFSSSSSLTIPEPIPKVMKAIWVYNQFFFQENKELRTNEKNVLTKTRCETRWL